MTALGFKPGQALSGWEYRTGRDLAVEGGVVSLNLQAETVAIVRVKPAGAN